MSTAAMRVVEAKVALAGAEENLKRAQREEAKRQLREVTAFCRAAKDEYLRLETEFKTAESRAALCELACESAVADLRQAHQQFIELEFPSDGETATFERQKGRLESAIQKARAERDAAQSVREQLRLEAVTAARRYEQLQRNHRNVKALANGEALGKGWESSVGPVT